MVLLIALLQALPVVLVCLYSNDVSLNRSTIFVMLIIAAFTGNPKYFLFDWFMIGFAILCATYYRASQLQLEITKREMESLRESSRNDPFDIDF